MYCSKCGVKLQEYHKTCVLCGQKITDDPAENFDYPGSKNGLDDTNKTVYQLFISNVVSTLLFLSSALSFIINLMLDGKMTWSIIVVSTLFVVSVAWQSMFMKKVSVFKLYSFFAITTSIVLVGINLILSSNISWAVYPVLGLFASWVILSGFIKKEQIKRKMPILTYYAIGFTFAFGLAFLTVPNIDILMSIIFPAFLSLIVATAVMYFIIEIMVGDKLGITIILIGMLAVLTVLTDTLISNYLGLAWMSSWAFMVLIGALPVIALGMILRKGNELRAYLVRKLHK